MEHWQWVALGVAFLIFEMFVPGAILVWFGLAALILGGLMFSGVGLSIGIQLLLFAILSLAGVLIGRRYINWYRKGDGSENLSKRGAHLIGREFTLLSDMENGQSKARVGDTEWLVRANPNTPQDLQAGTRVTVIGIKGSSLQVQPSET